MLGRFELLGLLSVGGMAEIYLARTEGIAGFEKLVVLKRMLPHFAMQAEFVEMFLAEARLGAMLDHPNVVAVHDIGEETGNYYYAMDYVRGADLRQIMKVQGRAGAMPLHCAIAIGLGMCAGLDHAHELTDHAGNLLGVVHRDVSLSNVLVSYDGAVKVTDFGVAKLTANDHRTRTGTLKGKIGYMSPEQCRGLALDRRSDIFAIGIIMYELSTGRRLFRPEESDFAVLEKIVKKDVVPPSKFRADYPPELEAIVLRALQRDRQQRYQTARDMQRDLESLARTERLPTSASELAEYVRALVPPTNPAADRTHASVMAPVPSKPSRPTGPTAPMATRPPTEAPADPWVSDYESLALDEAAGLTELAAKPHADARSRRRALLVLGGAALIGVIFAVVTVPSSEPAPAPSAPAARTAAAPDREPAQRPGAAIVSVPAPPPREVPAAEADDEGVVINVPAPPPPPPPRAAASTRERPRPREREVAQRQARPVPRPHGSASDARSIDAGSAPSPEPMPTLIDELEPDAGPPPAPTPTATPTTPSRPPPPPKPQPAPVKAVVVDAPDPGSFDAVPSIAGVDVTGPLQDSEIRRGVARVTSAFRACYRDAARAAGRTPAAKVRITFEIGVHRAARDVSAGRAPLPGLSSCLEDATSRIRTRIAPDVGNAQVTIHVSFAPTDS